MYGIAFPVEWITSFELKGRRVWIAGHRGMAGQALVRRLGTEPCEILTVGREDLDLRDASATRRWVMSAKPDVVVVAAGRVGGILANVEEPASFLQDNLAIASSVLAAAHRSGVEKLLYLGSSCAYPRDAPQPIAESALLTGPLESTNEGYALAKIAGVLLCRSYRKQYGADYVAAMPTNLYGPGDSFDPRRAHVPAALIRRFDNAVRSGADEVVVWGTGRPSREFLHVDDMADACVHLLRHYSDVSPVNVGTGRDIAIADFAALIARVVGFRGRILFDPSRPDGTPRKRLDVSMLTALGWRASIELEEGLARTYAWYRSQVGAARP